MRILLVVLVLVLLPLRVNAISAESYIVMDYDSGRVIEGKNILKEKLIASTTKIMTCIIALENESLDKEITVGKEVLKAYGSAIYISLDEKISLRDLLYGLMLRSGNDSAIEIAYGVSGDMAKFVKLMNEKAYELKMNHTVFYNNHGLEESDGSGNMSTAYDIALLMRYALKNEMFRKIIGTKSYTAKSSLKSYVWKNKNKLLFSYDNLIGGKTGFTKKARRTLVTSAKKDDKTTIVVTLNDGNDFSDHESLHEQVFKDYERVLVLDNEILKSSLGNEDYYLQEPFYVLLKDEEKKDIKIDFQLQENGLEVGNANIYLKDDLLGSVKIYKSVSNDVSHKEGFFKKFFRWLFKW